MRLFFWIRIALFLRQSRWASRCWRCGSLWEPLFSTASNVCRSSEAGYSLLLNSRGYNAPLPQVGIC